MTLQLRPYQEVGRDFLASRRHALLADEMRVGKTPQAILAAAKAGVESALVVCPAIAVPQWQAEWPRWHPGPLPRKLEVVSYDRARREAGRLKLGYWGVVIVDECHFAKNPAAKRTQLIYGKDGLGWHASRMWALSGTPATKSAADLWPMYYAFGVTRMHYTEFTQRYCTFNALGRIVGTNQAKLDELVCMRQNFCLRRTRAEVAPELPAIDFQFLNVDFAEKVDLPVNVMVDDDVQESDFDADDRQAVALAKVMPLAHEIVFALENELMAQTVVFGWHLEPLKQLRLALNTRGIYAELLTGDTPASQRTVTQERFREGKCQVVIANIVAAGTAIDLSAADHGYFLELDWLPSNNVQAANRLVSMEKLRPVSFDVVTAPGTVDARLQRVLLTRAQQLAKLNA